MADRIRDVMTPNPQTLSASATVHQAAETMRTHSIGDVIASDDKGGIAGLLTDRDIVVRVVAEGRDPRVTLIEEIVSRDLTAVSPDDPVERAVELMRERAVRRCGGQARQMSHRARRRRSSVTRVRRLPTSPPPHLTPRKGRTRSGIRVC